MTFISFSHLTGGSSNKVLRFLRTSNKMLTRVGESGYPCLVTDLRREVFSLSLWSLQLQCVGFLLMFLIRLRKFPSILSLLHFLKKSLKHIGFCQIFYLLRWSYGSCFLVYYSFLFGSFAVCIPYYALPLVSALLLFLDAKSLYMLHPLVETTLISFLSWLKA